MPTREALKKAFLLAHPPSGGVDPEKKPETEPKPQESNLAADIAAGIAKALPDAIRAATPAAPERVDSPSPAPLPAIDDVDERQIAKAFADGDQELGASLLKKARRADRERMRREDLSPILSNGGGAISELSEMSIQSEKHYKTYSKEVKAKVAEWQRANPNAIAPPAIWKTAYNLVIGEHADEIASASAEEAVRRSKEPDPILTPSGGRRLADEGPHEPQTLTEALGDDWKETFSKKTRSPGAKGRSEEAEMNLMGFKGVADFIAQRAAIRAQLDEIGNGLDREWSHKEQRYLTPQESSRLPLPKGL